MRGDARYVAMAALAFAAALSAGGVVDMEPPPTAPSVADIRAAVARLPKSSLSADGLVRVVAADVPGDEVGYRTPILNFATREIGAIKATYKVSAPKVREPAIVIYAMGGQTNDTRVISRAAVRNGVRSTRIWLPSPGHSDLDLLRVEVATAYLRVCGMDFPEWVVQGMMRGTNGNVVRTDTLFVLSLWATARLPFFPVLCTDLRAARGRGGALSGYVVNWMKEKNLIDVWRGRFAAGEKWSGERLVRDLTGEAEPHRQDRANDERLVRLTNSVLTPGRANPWDLSVFSSRLLLYPPFFDKIYPPDRSSCTFAEAINLAGESPELRRAALRRANEMPFYALGRGEDLAAAAFAYREFLLLVARGGKGGESMKSALEKAQTLLRKANEKSGSNED